MALPVPTLDHVVVNVRDRIDEGAETYRKLGFTLTPRGFHTLGSMNHLAMFGTDYLELIAAPAGETRRAEVLNAPIGLNGLVFGTDDSDAVYEALQTADVPVKPPQQFSRPVTLPNGMFDAEFRTVSIKPTSPGLGRIYFCHHLTRHLVWRDEWRHHPNQVIGVERAVIAAEDPRTLGGLFAGMFGDAAVRATADGYSLSVGLARFEIVKPETCRRMFGDAAAEGEGRTEYMAALTFRTLSVEAVRNAAGALVQEHKGAAIVPAHSAFGVTLEFVER